jgi:hypothetical protein
LVGYKLDSFLILLYFLLFDLLGVMQLLDIGLQKGVDFAVGLEDAFAIDLLHIEEC